MENQFEMIPNFSIFTLDLGFRFIQKNQHTYIIGIRQQSILIPPRGKNVQPNSI